MPPRAKKAKTTASEKGAKALCEALPSQPPYTAGTLALSSVNLASASPEELQNLGDACEPATFGRNQEHVLDETYRKAGKMDTTSFATSIIPERTGLIDAISTQLLDGPDSTHPVALELYKLNVYGEGSFFKAHKDTPPSETMFGSLVIVFPMPHERGSLITRHNDEEWTDVEHEITPITSGHRVTLTYNLYFGDIEIDSGESQPGIATRTSLAPVMSSGEQPFRSTFEDLLNNPEFLPHGGALGFGLQHEYPIKDSLEHVYKLLKGSDAVILRTCTSLSLPARLHLLYSDERAYSGGTTLDYVLKFGDHIKYVDVEDEVIWAVPTSHTKLDSKYVAHGNEPQIACAYGNVFLIVRVGKFDERSVVVDPLKERRRKKREAKKRAQAEAKVKEAKRRRLLAETKATEDQNKKDVAEGASRARA
ncbi:uncharacterized protein STEHIDRAFT_157738 [Stereum hirsutum FP-91666 SS1]|uniref:uncharacterized protein n=1 Tax=Stereum hirsutum (strain FP-91666) TaxID=721885 RepID=UPI00044494EF|nr:uncharacterized protein STEHIDRAFT_157738 [Stereum hirsutum FP-91666 SS1]EIM86235.1 hypothetical protein STEHIDRAFT_157738 [Stereum hirsutum FP-91666 SS1]